MSEQLNARIDVLLAQHRPDRYQPGVEENWLLDIARAIEDDIPAKEIRRRHALTLVKSREGVKTQGANRLLRQIHNTGEIPFDWLDTLHLPLAVGKERVALRACTIDDLRRFAIDERRDASREFAVRHDTCEAADWLADEMSNRGVDFIHELT